MHPDKFKPPATQLGGFLLQLHGSDYWTIVTNFLQIYADRCRYLRNKEMVDAPCIHP